MLSVIKGVLHDFCGQKCAMASTWHTHRQLHNCIQKEDEDTEQFHERFKNQVEVKEGHVGKLGTQANLFKYNEECMASSIRDKECDNEMKTVKE